MQSAAAESASLGMHSPDAADGATSAGAVSVLPSLDAVSESADARMTDEQREAAIKHAGNLLMRFSSEGKRAQARQALRLMHALIAGRSADWISRREAQIQQAIARDTGCFFMEAGERDRKALASNEELQP
jgi:hypothetical protein